MTKKILKVISVIVALAAIAAVVYYFFQKKNREVLNDEDFDDEDFDDDEFEEDEDEYLEPSQRTYVELDLNKKEDIASVSLENFAPKKEVEEFFDEEDTEDNATIDESVSSIEEMEDDEEL